MRHLFFILLSVLALTGCHTSKTAAERAAEKREKFVADSIKYAAVKGAFTKGDFVFKLTRKNGVRVNELENWLLFSDGKVRYQRTNTGLFARSVGSTPSGGGQNSVAGRILDIEESIDSKKKTITLVGRVEHVFSYFSITLFEGSNKAYGSLWKSNYPVEGWIEPLNQANIVRGWESPIHK